MSDTFDPDTHLDASTSNGFDPDTHLTTASSLGIGGDKYDPSEGGGSLSIGPFDTGIHTPQWLDRGLAGVGKQFVDLGHGLRQALPAAVPITGPHGSISDAAARQTVEHGRHGYADVAAGRVRDQPLMDTTAGTVGNVIGGIATSAPAMMIPGAATPLGSTAIGAGLGAAQPSTSPQETALNTAAGGALGLAGQQLGSAIKPKAGVPRTPSVSDEALAEGQRLGYVVPPATSNRTFGNKMLEGFAGKLSTGQAASVKNQAVTNSIVQQEFGLPEGAQLTHDTLAGVRAAESPHYEAVKAVNGIQFGADYERELANLTKESNVISKDLPDYKHVASDEITQLVKSLKPVNGTMDGPTAVELTKSLRAQAQAYEVSASRGGNPTDRALARAYRGASEAVENAMVDHLTNIGQPELATNLDNARRTIAKSYSVEAALDGAGNVDATKLGKQLIRGKPLSGNLESVANFANAFPKAARVMTKESVPGMSPLDYAAAGTAAFASHNPLPLALAPTRWAARSAMLSDAVNPTIARPGGVSALIPNQVKNSVRIGRNAASYIPQPLGYSGIPVVGTSLSNLLLNKQE